MTMDFTTDQNPTALYEVGIKAGDKLPEYVKEASVLQAEDVAPLANIAFADSFNRLFPIHTKAATYMSAVYLAGNGDTKSHTFKNVQKAAEFYGITEDVDAAIDLLPQTEKSASAKQEKYALHFNLEEENSWEAYPINNEVEVSKAAMDVLRDWHDDHIPADWFFRAAQNVVKQAHALNIDHNTLPAAIWSVGEERLVDFNNALEAAKYRAREAGEKDYAEAVKEAAEGKITVDEMLDKWMFLDVLNSVNHKTAGTPHEILFSGPLASEVEKLAAERVFIQDVLVPTEAVKKLAADNGKSIKRAFRKEVAENIISIVSMLDNSTAKSAAEATKAISKLAEEHRKELLNLLLEVA